MVKYKEKYQKIIDELISKSFPSLKKKEIKILKIPFISFLSFGTVVRGKKKNYLVLFGEPKQKKSYEASVGFLAHELSHLEDLEKLSVLRAFLEYNIINDLSIDFLFLPIFNKMERDADVKAIKKGYAKNLFINHKTVAKRYPKWIQKMAYKRGYFSPEQIKSYAKKIGKW